MRIRSVLKPELMDEAAASAALARTLGQPQGLKIDCRRPASSYQSS
jgi:hypothetical protein